MAGERSVGKFQLLDYRTGEGYHIVLHKGNIYLLTPFRKVLEGIQQVYFNVTKIDLDCYIVEGVIQHVKNMHVALAKAMVFRQQIGTLGSIQYRFLSDDGDLYNVEQAIGKFMFPITVPFIADEGRALSETFSIVSTWDAKEIELCGEYECCSVHLLADRLGLHPLRCWSTSGVFADGNRHMVLFYDDLTVTFYWNAEETQYKVLIDALMDRLSKSQVLDLLHCATEAGSPCNLCGAPSDVDNMHHAVNIGLVEDAPVICGACLVNGKDDREIIECMYCHSPYTKDQLLPNPKNGVKEICPYCKQKDISLYLRDAD